MEQPQQLYVLTGEQLKEFVKELADEITEQVVRKLRPQYMTRKEVAAKLHVVQSTIINWVEAGLIKEYRIAGKVLYDPVEVESKIRSGEVKVKPKKLAGRTFII